MITISCLCGAARQTLSPPPQADSNSWPSITFCHCDSCRHLTGLLSVSYTPIASTPSLAGLTKYPPYSTPSSSTRYFCATCGCHIFRHSNDTQQWEVATGTITSSPPLSTPPPPIHIHNHTSSTVDGGLSIWLPGSPPLSEPTPNFDTNTTLPASCRCGRISFTITRPSKASTLPHSGYADLLVPFHSTPSSVTSNPHSIKWWLRDPSPTASPPSTDALHHPSTAVLATEADSDLARYKYLAGTCACQSCRLASGFEVQTWAFVPRANILMDIPSLAGEESVELGLDGVGRGSVSGGTGLAEVKGAPLDFSAIPHTLLTTYHSSEAAVREFCPTCGATVFWHDYERPDLIDVSVGLLRCSSGARAEPFLKWWTERTSFSEETRTGRTGGIADWSERLITDLESSMHNVEG